ncbi:gibberellin 3-beta-dioxygenase 1-like [Diospyros lotus]|uniref:gibberellin 3-beta-dioxygenase 1-like n=1 Tax=Diospyros lotus TaxID=55363 RepID=UPI002254DEEB|nr:gibberellin 3-beta-dioxygenase 1-like [Diospyros lotus]
MGSTLSEAYRDSPLQLHHIVPLDFRSVQTLPNSHVWSQSDRDLPCGVPIGEDLQIPVIDLLDSNVEELVGDACRAWGIFQVTNHGLPSDLLEDVESKARRLFALPAGQKIKVLRSPDGCTGYGMARISPFFPKFMWHEGFTMMGSPVDHARVLWPHDYKRFCEVMEEYQKAMKTLAHKLLLIILKSLDVYEEEKQWSAMVQNSDAGALQLNSYPSCPDPTRAIGLAPHTDTLLLTILNQTRDTKGLQIFREGVGWAPVSPVAGALTVNVGDLLHIFSNAKFPTVYHRAAVNQTCHRLSVAYFYGPQADSIVAPFSKLQSPLYRSLTVKEYVSLKAKHLERAMSLIRI